MDDCRSWVVLGVSVVSYGASFGMTWSMGVYMVPLLEDFGADKRPTALALSIALSLCLFLGPISSVTYKLIGCRWVLVSSGLIAAIGYLFSWFSTNVLLLTLAQALVGIGFGLIGPALMAVQAQYFCKYRNLATSLVMVGGPLGLFMFPQMFTWLIDVYGWRGSMLINAGLALQLVVAGAMIRPVKPTHNQDQTRDEKIFETWIFKNPKCWLIWCIVGGFKGLVVLYMTFINAYLLEKGIKKHVAAVIMSLSGITNLAARFFGSLLVHKTRIGAQRMAIVCVLAIMVAQPILTGLGQSELVYGVAVGLVGLSDGFIMALIISVVINQFEPKVFATIWGINWVASGISATAWSQIGGKVADNFNLTCTIYLSSCPGCMALLAGVGLFVFGLLESRSET